MHLGQVFVGRVPLQWQLHVQVLGDGRVHDAARQYVGETAVVAGAPGVGHEDTANESCWVKNNLAINVMQQTLYQIRSSQLTSFKFDILFYFLFVHHPDLLPSETRTRLSPPAVIAVRTVWYTQTRRQHSHGVCEVVVVSAGGLFVVGQLKKNRTASTRLQSKDDPGFHPP